MSPEQLLSGAVIPIDKPRGWTSFQAVGKVKGAIRQAFGLNAKLKVPVPSPNGRDAATCEQHTLKIGHAGTLDPLATGLLLICVGKATKTIPQLQDGDKVYTGTIVLGATTPCYDLERPIDSYYPYEHITQQLVETAAAQLTGTIMQVPPMFSAVKVDGQRAYQYARQGDPSVTIQPKAVNVYSFDITAFRQPSEDGAATTPDVRSTASDATPSHHLYLHPLGEVPAHLPQVDFRIHCGKGTYIRSLARDLGAALGSGAFLAALRREKIGPYTIDQALQLNEVASFLSA